MIWKKSKAQTLLRQAFLARTYHTLEMVPDLPESVQASGGWSAEPFAWYDHGSRCWRTWQRCLIEGWGKYSEAWPRSGMTRNGIAYRFRPLARPTDGTEFVFLPTPRANHAQKRGNFDIQNKRNGFPAAVKRLFLPTLGKNETKGASRKRHLGSPHFRGAKMSEALRTCEEDPTYLHPSFAEAVMGFPIGWGVLPDAETPIPPLPSKVSATQS
jgi:DNA (cytosine-5)-methyltransferase 1